MLLFECGIPRRVDATMFSEGEKIKFQLKRLIIDDGVWQVDMGSMMGQSAALFVIHRYMSRRAK